MLRSPGIYYLVIVFASLGLLSLIALDALRGRSHDHVRAARTSPDPNGPRDSRSGSQNFPIKPVAETVTLAAPRIPAFGPRAEQQATPATTAAVAIPPSAVDPAPAVQAVAPWSIATVTTSFTRAARSSVAAPGEAARRSPNCLAVWDRETHMTKDEWKAACGRAPRLP
jgi:hypothetical protein